MLSRWNTGWSDFENMFATMNQLRNYIDRVVDGGWAAPVADASTWSAASVWPRANLTDTGKSLVLTAEVPGMSEQDLQVTLNQDVLTISGERKVAVPEGYSVHRQERAGVRFSRSFALPSRVVPDKVSAVVKAGILTVTMEKAAEAMPRQIAVKVES
jgi:HSP20 family protein